MDQKKLTMVVVAIIVVAVLAYGGYRVVKHFSQPAPVVAPETNQQTPAVTPTQPAATDNGVFKTASDPTLGAFLTDMNGMTLYTYSKDTAGVSTCSGQCLAIWPAFGPVAGSPAVTLPAGVTVITRADGTSQYALNGMPLYTYVKDTKPGDVTGQGVGGVWSVAKPQ